MGRVRHRTKARYERSDHRGISRRYREAADGQPLPRAKHQRDYSWTEDEGRQLFDDLESTVEKKTGVYFLGLMVFLHTTKGKLVVLDGRQRLATAVVIFSAIRSLHVIGVLADALSWMRRSIEDELNSANDNPIIDPTGERVLTAVIFTAATSPSRWTV